MLNFIKLISILFALSSCTSVQDDLEIVDEAIHLEEEAVEEFKSRHHKDNLEEKNNA